jgi:hypothetical protein
MGIKIENHVNALGLLRLRNVFLKKYREQAGNLLK